MAGDRLGGMKTLKVGGFLEEFEKEDIKRKVDIIRLFESFGVTLNRKGKGYAGLCPWHEDREPSLSVDQEKGLYHCFGCGESGDVVSLVEKMKGLRFREAMEYLKRNTGSVQPQKRRVKKITVQQEKPEEKETHSEITLTTITEHYHKRFYDSSEARAYLAGRGIRSPETYTRFRIGFADGSLPAILSNGQKGRLKELGVLRATGREHFYHHITIPIVDDTGRSVGLYGRSINDRNKVKHLYLPGKHKGVFNRKASKVFEEVILTESIIDVLSLIELGFENVQALYGLNGLTPEHLETLRDDRVKTVILALDSDEAGRKGAEKLKNLLISESFGVKIIFPPQGKDWNDSLLAHVDPAGIRESIKKAETTHPKESGDGMRVSREGIKYFFTLGEIAYRLLGVGSLFISHLRVNIKAEYKGESFYDNLDLYSARSRTQYSQNLSQLFALEPKRIEKDLLKILEYLEEERDRKLSEGERTLPQKELTEQDKKLGMDFLKSPDLFEQIVKDMESLGYVGEKLNKQLVYLAASSRKLDDPISILILSQSAAGKSLLVDTVKRLLPQEDVISVTSLSDQALNYLPEGELLHKFLILGEAVHSEVIEHQIREMLSAHELSRMVTIKDEKTGKMITENRKSKVIVSAIMSSTCYEINPENSSRCFLINADESGEQTKRIHQAQRGKYSLQRYYETKHTIPQIIRKHTAAQKLLRNVLVVNPFGKHLDFPTTLIRTRRDHERFVDLIACVCFLRQCRKELKKGRNPVRGEEVKYVECDLADYRIAYRIMVEGVLSSTFAELPNTLVRFYEELREIFHESAAEHDLKPLEISLTQRDIRKRITWVGSESIKKYLRKLVGYEYLQIDRGAGRGMRNSYRLVADESIQRLDYTMIPAPEEISKRMG